jgi:hypothetical protein
MRVPNPARSWASGDPFPASEMMSFRAFPISGRKLTAQRRPTCLTTFVTNSLTIRAKGIAMSVGTSTRWTPVVIPSGQPQALPISPHRSLRKVSIRMTLGSSPV